MNYSYRCRTCGKVFEKELNFKHTKILKELGQIDTPNCIHCNSSNVIKLISSSTTIFKGEGFTKSLGEQ